ncbi:MAG: mandelate racemase/muconate lactonizing enzyme family protein [Desulfuromusa sp.]|nr:mandelate racemase/muconate lactonizing enzyme family protein [Desulfuromusa sp.]
MKIAKIKASLHRHEIHLPDIESVETRTFVFCEVETESGLKGMGCTGHFLPWSTMPCIEQHIFPLIKGMDVFHTEAIHQKVWRQLNSRTYTGVISNALSAIDSALWDIKGKATDRSISELLGGFSREAQTYATFGYPFFDEKQLADYAKKFLADGHTKLKMVVGGEPSRTWKDDVPRVQAARDAIGPDVDLMIDANCWFHPHDAFQLAKAVEDCNLAWFEEPILANDARALADLRNRVTVPIGAGQMEGNRFRFRELITHHAVDVLQPNVLYNGGYTEALKVAHMAQAFNLPMANGGGWPMFNMHLLAGVMNGGPVEFHYGMWMTGKHFFDGTPDPVNGVVTIPDRPGLGFTPKYDALEDARLKTPAETNMAGFDSHGYKLR